MPTIHDVLQTDRDLTSLETHLHETHKLHTTGHTTDRTKLPACGRARRDAMYFCKSIRDVIEPSMVDCN